MCALSAFVLGANTQAATADSAGHPYKNIPAANIFRLKSPSPEPSEPPQAPPPPIITLQGITDICGRPQALCKVATPNGPPGPARELAYVLSEGERAGEIEVLEINGRSGTVKFRNHGVVQTVALRNGQMPAGARGRN